MNFVERLRNGQNCCLVTYGTSLTASGAWVTLLKEELARRFPGQADVVNSGMGGKWSQTGVESISEKVLAYRPAALFIEFAMNDAFLNHRTSVAAARLNLEYILDRTAEESPDCEFILMTMNPPTGIHLERRPRIDDYYDLYREVAAEQGLTLLDHHRPWQELLTRDRERFFALVPDGIHPSPEGSRLITYDLIARHFGLS